MNKIDGKKYYSKEEAMDIAFSDLKKLKLIPLRRIRVWRHRWKQHILRETTVNEILKMAGFEKTIEWYSRIRQL